MVDEFEGRNTGAGLQPTFLLIFKGDVAPADYGLLQRLEGRFSARQVLVVMPSDDHRCLESSVENVAQEVV